ncbi:27327_t:CDS:2, partial [Racocetra persica]
MINNDNMMNNNNPGSKLIQFQETYEVKSCKLKSDEVTELNRDKQQLKAARSKKRKHTFDITNISDYKNLDDHIWSDKDIDRRASDYFAVLLMAGKNINIWKPSGRPSIYFGGSKRTQRHKKAELKKAAQNNRSITTYLAPALAPNIASASTLIGMKSIDVESME